MSSHDRSQSFHQYLINRRQVIELVKTIPPELEQQKSRSIRSRAEALYRGSVVLLSGHLEGFCENLITEAIDVINKHTPNVKQVPENLRLIHMESVLIGLDPDHKKIATRMERLRNFARDFVLYWDDFKPIGRLNSDYIVQRFANPSPDKINGLFACFNIENIVELAMKSDKSADRAILKSKVQDLIDKRNTIAHESTAVTLTRKDIEEYLRCSLKLVYWIDVVITAELQKIIGNRPWI